ncbi:hypothetical protein LXL04_037656 [Taraxacum kok-saghyz]
MAGIARNDFEQMVVNEFESQDTSGRRRRFLSASKILASSFDPYAYYRNTGRLSLKKRKELIGLKVHWKYVSMELKIVVRAESARDNHRNDCKMLTKNLKAAFLVNDIDDELLELAHLRLTPVPSRDVSSAEENEDDAARPAGDAVGSAGDAVGGAPGDDRGADA